MHISFFVPNFGEEGREMRDVAAVMVVIPILIGILVLGPTSANGDTNQSDASALRVIYESLNSPTQLTKWSSSGGDPCGESWKGIACSGSRVTEIKLSGLGLSGSLGYQLSSLTSLTNFDVSSNNLGNQIPYQLPPNVQRLNLAGCGFSGSIPYSISQMTSVKYLNLSHNLLQGQLNDVFASLSALALSTLDLSFNMMTGNLPKSFSSLSSMTNMYLQNNQFTGTMDVLSNLPLKKLNVENNRFSGRIPEKLKNINLQSSSPGTPPVRRPNRNHHSNSNNSRSDGDGSGGRGDKTGIKGASVAAIVIFILFVGAVVGFFIMKRRSRRSSSKDIEKLDNQHFTPLASQEVQEMKSIQTLSKTNTKTFETSASINLRPPPIDRYNSFEQDDFSRKPVVTDKINTAPINAVPYSIADLQMATASFGVENLVGEGSIGCVYQAQFDSGKVLAVKKIISSALTNQLSKDFKGIVSDISRLRHPNVTELVGYCSDHGQHLLVYEFHEHGSLHDFLHLSDEYSNPLTWNRRVKIALGTARALEYLHEVCSPSVVHKNFKSTNIFLDMEFNPHLSDCGLASLVLGEDQALNNNVGSGYSAPEVSMSGQYTVKSDVYSFGVVMLELLSGRQPFDSSRPKSEQYLVRWATPQLHDIDALADMADPSLKGLYPAKSLSRFADVIALCVQSEPEFRPPMSEVVEALVRLVQRAGQT